MDIDDAKRAMTYVMQKEAVTLPPLEQGETHEPLTTRCRPWGED
jgi:hypothetical protein